MMDEMQERQMLPMDTLLQDGKYRVVRYMASGGFGNTYEVEHVKLHKRMAMKEFYMRGINQRQGTTVSVSQEENRTTFNQMRTKFYNEAKRLASLEEQHIVEVSDFFEENQTAYYVMRLVDGVSLAVKMKRMGHPLGEDEVRSILPQILSALKLSHGQGIFHLDIKPGNIMQNAQGFCWLIDFGASKQMSTQESMTLSTSTGLCYTPGFAPSEQISGSTKRIGPWTDFYALGATLYKLLTNEAPPEVDDVTYEGEAAFHFPSSVSSDMRQLVLWLMQADYRCRPQSVADIESRLSTTPVDTPTPSEETVTSDSAYQPESEETRLNDTPVQPELTKPVQPTDISSTIAIANENAPRRYRLWAWLIGGSVACVLLGVFLLRGNMNKENIPELPSEELTEEAEEIPDYLFPFKEGDLYGYMDIKGNTVLAPQWFNAIDFSEGLACVSNADDKYGFIDETGTLVIPYKWPNPTYFSEGLARISDENYNVGFIDKTGQVVIPCKWRDASYFHEGYSRVCSNNNLRWGYIDKTGKEVLPCKWFTADPFSEGLAEVENSSGYSFIDKTGETVFPHQWEIVYPFHDGLAAVMNKQHKWGCIDKTGQVVIPCQWNSMYGFSEGLCYVADQNDKYGFIDKSGTVVIECKWDEAWEFHEGMAPVKKDDKVGFINKNGELVVPCQWKDFHSFFLNGLAVVYGFDENEYYIDKTGKVIRQVR